MSKKKRKNKCDRLWDKKKSQYLKKMTVIHKSGLQKKEHGIAMVKK